MKEKNNYIDIGNLFKGENPDYVENCIKKGHIKDNKIYLFEIDKLTNPQGYSLLHHAVVNGDEILVSSLLANDAAVNLPIKKGDRKGHTPIKLVIDKIKESLQANREEEAARFKSIQSLLLDYGANHAPFEAECAEIRKTKTEENTINKKNKNKDIVKECAEGNVELEEIYLNFYNFLQAKFHTTITGVEAAAAGILQIKESKGTKIVSTASKTILKSIPGIGEILSTAVDRGYKYFANKQEIEVFIHKANCFKNSKHKDKVNMDFCARMTIYYREDIINPDVDMGHRLSEQNLNNFEKIELSLKSLLSGIAKKELLAKYQREGEKIIKPHWKQIAGKCMEKFLIFLKNNEVSSRPDLGIKAAESFLPNFSKGSLQLEPQMDRFNIDTAKKLGLIAQLAYESRKKIEAVSRGWGFEGCYVRQSDLFKSLVMWDKEKIIIGFRGTYHNQNWLNNIHTLKETIKIKGKEIILHKGFYQALVMHWDKGNASEKPLKEIIHKYLIEHPAAKIYIAGHSLGGAMASIAYCKLLELETENGKNLLTSQISLYTYGQPLWATNSSETIIKELFKANYYRIVNYQDLVPTVPLETMGYKHLGELYYLHKDGKILDQISFDRIGSEKDEEGYDQVTKNPIAKLLYVEQHFMNNYNKQLDNHKEVVVSNEVPILQVDKVDNITAEITNTDPLSKESLSSLGEVLTNSLLEGKQQELLLKLLSKNKVATFMNLIEAIESKDVEAVQLFLKQEADISETDSIIHSALYIAVSRGDEKIVGMLLEINPDFINNVYERGNTALHIAASRGDEKIVEILLETNLELIIDKADARGNTALHIAASRGDKKVVEMLLERKPYMIIDKVDNDGRTALHIAAFNGHEKVVKMLLKRKPEIDKVDNNGRTALHIAAFGGDEKIVEMLLERKPEVDKADNNGRTALHIAASRGDEKVVKMLLKINPDLIDKVDEKGNTTLHIAASSGHEKIVEMLLERKPEIDKVDNDGRTALHIAASRGDKKVVGVLLERKPDMIDKIIKNQDYKVMYYAAFSKHEEIIGKLLHKMMHSVIDKPDNCSNTISFNTFKDKQKAIIKWLFQKNDWDNITLHTAASRGDEEVVEMLLERKPNLIDKVDEVGYTALHDASSNGHEKVVNMLLERKPDMIGMVDNYGSTALHKAAFRGNEEVVNILLKKNHDLIINKADERGNTALHLAASKGSEKVVNMLLERKPNMIIDKVDNDGRTALHIAVSRGDEKVVEILLKIKPEIDKADERGNTALHIAVSNEYKRIVEMLLEGKPEVDKADKRGYTALHIAASKGAEEVVEMLLKIKPNIDKADEGGKTALHIAVSNGCKRIVEMLLERKPEIDKADERGKTALHIAASKGDEKIVEMLLERKPEIDKADKRGNTALHDASSNGHEKVVNMLLERKPDMIDKADERGNTALHIAVSNEYKRIVEMLLEGKPEVDKADKRGYTALHIAASKGAEEVVEMLLKIKPNIDKADKRGNTALHAASSNGHEKVVNMLLERKPDMVDMADSDGNTALHIAASRRHGNVVEILLKRGAKCSLEEIDLLASNAYVKEMVAECYYLYGVKKSKENNETEVFDAYEKALNSNPYIYDLTSRFVSKQLKLNNNFIQQLEQQKESKFIYQKAIVYLLKNDFEEALAIFNSVVEEEVKAAFSLGKTLALVRLEKYTEAEQQLIDYHNINKKLYHIDYHDTHFDYQSFKRGLMAGAKQFKELYADYWYIRGELMSGMKQYKEAFECYNKLLITYEDHAEAIIGISNLYLKTDKLSQAKECYQKILISKFASPNLVEIAEQQISVIETSEFFTKQMVTDKEVQNLTIEFNESLERIKVTDVISASKWLQGNLPIIYQHEVLKQIEYGYSLLDSKEISPNAMHWLSDLFSCAGYQGQVDNKLRKEHSYFKKINNILRNLDSLKEIIKESNTNDLNANIKDIAFKKIEHIQNYYQEYIGQVLNTYGADYYKTINQEYKYFTNLSNIAEKKEPLFDTDKLDVMIQSEDGSIDFLHPTMIKKLIISKPQTEEKFGKHSIVKIDSVHYKYSPYAPGIEFAVNSLHNLILEDITPPNKIIKIYSSSKTSKSSEEKAIYLASKTIDGINLHTVLTHSSENIRQLLKKIDMENYSGIIISCLLTSPGDAKPDNFMTTHGRDENTGQELIKIIGIDSDISFCKGKLGINNVVGTHKIYSDILNVLYFFPQMDEFVNSNVKKHLLDNNIVGEQIISAWLNALYTKNQTILKSGFTPQELEELKLPIKLKAGTVIEVYRKLEGIIATLKANEYVTHNDLFRKFYPGISYFYEKTRKEAGGEFESIIKLYEAAVTNEELAKQLESRKTLDSRRDLQLISTARMLNKEIFAKTYDNTIEKEAESFISAIDFSKFGREDYTIFKILQNNLSFIQELRLHNITLEQIEKLVTIAINEEIVSAFKELKTIRLIEAPEVTDIELQNLLKQYYSNKISVSISSNEEEYQDYMKQPKGQLEFKNIQGLINNRDINQQDKKGNTALHNAVIKGDAYLVKSLLDQGVDESIKNNQGKKALELAEEKEELVEIYQLIAEYEPEIFWIALHTGNANIVARLAKTMSIEKLSMPIRDNNVVNSSLDVLEIALTNDKLVNTVSWLIEKLDVTKSYGKNCESSLHLLTRNYNDTHVSIIEEMIKKSPSLVERVNKDGQTVADIALSTKKYNFLTLLINKKCTLNRFDTDNQEIAYKAAKYGITLSRSDLENKYDYTKQDSDGNDILKLAIKNRDFDLYKKIKAAGYYDKQLESLYDDQGNHKLACDDQTKKLINILREYSYSISEEEAITGKLNLNQLNQQGNSVLYELLKTVSISDKEMDEKENKIDILIEAGIDVNASNRQNKWTVLHLVISSNQPYYLGKLLEAGGKLLPDAHHHTPREIAKRYQYNDIENILDAHHHTPREIAKRYQYNDIENILSSLNGIDDYTADLLGTNLTY